MKYTPSSIVKQKLLFSIPIYQRLFEWDDENIQTLLQDLYQAFINSKGEDDYYIGMLTSKQENGCLELIDGQQRFTVLMLIACALKENEQWKRFIGSDPLRLRFTSRPKDDDYLKSLADSNNNCDGYENLKMKEGLSCIKDFFSAIKEQDAIEVNHFADYIFNHLSLFISCLPNKYGPQDLNKYFERMNTTGKNLEQHEILKVKLLKNLSNNVSAYMLLWNKLSDVDTLLIRKHNNELEPKFQERKTNAFRSTIDDLFEFGIINGLGTVDDIKTSAIADIPPSSTPPKSEKERANDSHCALSFPYLLLQTLYLKIQDKNKVNITEFFKPSNLLETFQTYLPYEGDEVKEDDILDFMDLLVKCRLALDICFIRPSEYGYSLDMNLSEDDEALKKLLMFESMLYVSSSNYTHYRWFGWLMSSLKKHKGIPTADDLFKDLKCNDDSHNNIPKYESLSYGDIRYWFWRLDFIIWENRKTIFTNSPEALTVAENYVFRRNRSIEHIAPQTPKSDSDMKWDDTEEDKQLMNSFGNLVMISQGLNSTLSHESYEVKKAHVESYCNGSKGGSIESLKLLVVHQHYKKWDRNSIEKHGHLMYDWLEKSFQM